MTSRAHIIYDVGAQAKPSTTGTKETDPARKVEENVEFSDNPNNPNYLSEESLTRRSFADGARIKLTSRQNNSLDCFDSAECLRFHPLLAPAQDDVEICHSEGEARRISYKDRGQYMPPRAKSAFTLAEVLITLGVIGVVAAITIPGLMTAYKAHQLRSQFLKSYSVVQQVFKQMEADDISMDPTTFSGGKMYDIFKNYLTGITECGKGNNATNKKFKPCYDYTDTLQTYKNLQGNALPSRLFDDGQLVLPDGSLILFENPNQGGGSLGTFYVWVHVDLNGFNNPPNRWGYDLFTFEFLDGELRTMGDVQTQYSDLNKYCSTNSNNSYNGIACAMKAKTNTSYFKDVVKRYK